MLSDMRATRNHLLAMTALAMLLGGGLVLVDPGIGSAVALPLAYLVGQSTGATDAALSRKQMPWAQALLLAGLAAALHVGMFLCGLGLSMARDIGNILPIRYGVIGIIVAITAAVGGAATLAGLRVGAALTLRRQARDGDRG